MKTTHALLLFFTMILASCTADEGSQSDGLPYYRFSEHDLQKLMILPTVGDTKTYQNQDGETITFTIHQAEQGKTTYSTSTFWGDWSPQHFHYDRQIVKMNYGAGPDAEIELKRYPLDSDYQVQEPIVGTPTFSGRIVFPLWNGLNAEMSNPSIAINFGLSALSMTFNGKTYDKVYSFSSGSSQVLFPNVSLPLRPRNVNKIYYDIHDGIIGFDDVDGKQWRLL